YFGTDPDAKPSQPLRTPAILDPPAGGQERSRSESAACLRMSAGRRDPRRRVSIQSAAQLSFEASVAWNQARSMRTVVRATALGARRPRIEVVERARPASQWLVIST